MAHVYTGKIAFFSRSANAKSPASSTLFWAGDQLTSWDQYDGMRSALSAMLSGGLSGMSMTHSDTGGYTEFAEHVYRMTRTTAMLVRWLEMETFRGTMLRTHPGLLPDLSAQVNTSAVTLKATRLASKLHGMLHPYRSLLMKEAATAGIPLVRYMFLEFPQAENTWSSRDQFMLGHLLLVAPVFTPRSTTRTVYFPLNSTWQHVFTKETIQGQGTNVTVAVPMGTPAVFFRQNQNPLDPMVVVCESVVQNMYEYWKTEQTAAVEDWIEYIKM